MFHTNSACSWNHPKRERCMDDSKPSKWQKCDGNRIENIERTNSLTQTMFDYIDLLLKLDYQYN